MAKQKNSDDIAKQHLEKLDKKHGQNIDPEHTDIRNKKTKQIGGKTIVIDNSELRGENPEDRFSSANKKGWIDLPFELLPTKGMFYPDNTELLIKAAEVGEIKHWSTLDTSNFIDIDSKMNYVIERCVKFVEKDTSAPYSWKDLIEIDRLYIMFRISELTLPGDINKLEMTFSCNEACKAPRSEMGQYKKTVTLKSSDLDLFVLDDYLIQLFNKEQKCFYKLTKSGDALKFYIPSIGVSSAIKNYIVDQREKGEVIDPYIIKVMPYLINDYKNINPEYIQKFRVDSMGWKMEKVLFIDNVVERIEKSVKLMAVHKCQKCSAALEVPLFFRGEPEIKNLLSIPGGMDELV